VCTTAPFSVRRGAIFLSFADVTPLPETHQDVIHPSSEILLAVFFDWIDSTG
jgi:hypothetical protein